MVKEVPVIGDQKYNELVDHPGNVARINTWRHRDRFQRRQTSSDSLWIQIWDELWDAIWRGKNKR